MNLSFQQVFTELFESASDGGIKLEIPDPDHQTTDQAGINGKVYDRHKPKTILKLPGNCLCLSFSQVLGGLHLDSTSAKKAVGITHDTIHHSVNQTQATFDVQNPHQVQNQFMRLPTKSFLDERIGFVRISGSTCQAFQQMPV